TRSWKVTAAAPSSWRFTSGEAPDAHAAYKRSDNVHVPGQPRRQELAWLQSESHPMCFSAEVSFGSAATLIAAGAWCLRTAYRRAPWFWPLAIVPCLFGVQQASEGLVWMGLHRRADGLVQVAAGVYLFFALAFWPTWFSVAASAMESKPGRRRFLALW